MSKKDQILELSAQGKDAATIAERVDTSVSYVYKVRSEGNTNSADTNSSRSLSSTPSAEADDSADSSASIEALDEPVNENANVSDQSRSDSGPDRDDLTFGDDPEPKEFSCGSCDASVPYLEKHCPDCGEKLMWSKIDS